MPSVNHKNERLPNVIRAKLFKFENQTTSMKDTFKHQGKRNQLVKVLQKNGIADENVLQAIQKVNRHL